MKSLFAALFAACALAAPVAHAESWFQFEAGLGGQFSADMGDGVWRQDGVAHSTERMYSPALLAGFTGNYGNWQWHVDYVWFGQMSASCVCVPDSAYNNKTHVASEPGYIPFNGFGHTQGVAATIGYGITRNGWRYGVEAGPWIYWATWHESRIDPEYPNENNLWHPTVPQLGWVAGARIERDGYSLSYRYYSASQRWNPYPAMVTGTHMFMLSKQF